MQDLLVLNKRNDVGQKKFIGSQCGRGCIDIVYRRRATSNIPITKQDCDRI